MCGVSVWNIVRNIFKVKDVLKQKASIPFRTVFKTVLSVGNVDDHRKKKRKGCQRDSPSVFAPWLTAFDDAATGQ